jgi:hypothetical protein
VRPLGETISGAEMAELMGLPIEAFDEKVNALVKQGQPAQSRRERRAAARKARRR